MTFVPAHSVVGPLAAQRMAFVLHGILGSARNFQGFVRKLQAEHPEWCFVLVDIRGHGASLAAPPPHSLRTCAEDLEHLAREFGRTPQVLIGHSFGGKVCLQYAQSAGHEIQQLWLLDSNPRALELDPDSEVKRVLAAARSVPQPIVRRNEVSAALLRHGLGQHIASWMATNLRLRGERYEWTLDFDIAQELLEDYCRLDFAAYLQDPKQAPVVHWVIGQQSDRITHAQYEWAQALAPSSRVSAHLLADAGHWLHVDNPEGLLDLFSLHFPP